MPIRLLIFTPILTVLGLLTMVFAQLISIPNVTKIDFLVKDTPCDPSVSFLKGEPVNLQKSILWGPGIIRLKPCSDGHLEFSAEGLSLNGSGPHLVVSQGPIVLWEGEITDLKDFTFPFTGNTWLSLANVRPAENDQHRKLFIHNLNYTQGLE